jgi:hypothetical protein
MKTFLQVFKISGAGFNGGIIKTGGIFYRFQLSFNDFMKGIKKDSEEKIIRSKRNTNDNY